jgi:hypothetical protein
MDLISELEDGSDEKKELLEFQERLIRAYDSLSNKYHSEKAGNNSNSLVLG